jgi:ribosomal-protein-alanine N-acetyltransferase
MRLPLWPRRPRDYAVETLEPGHAGAIAAIHQESFARPWSDVEFAALLGQEPVFGYLVREAGRHASPLAGFVLARLAAGEAEILTIAVARAYRRLGLGWKLIDAVLRRLHAERAEALFLEVDETNAPALALYRRLGFREVGRRPGYYRSKDGDSTGALVMRRDLR